jgi:tetratricopeptide (TPR) repeat protein
LALALLSPIRAQGAAATSPTAAAASGAKILKIDETSPWYLAGIRRGDIITKARGRDVRGDSEFWKHCAGTTGTAPIEVEGLRGGKPFHLTLPFYVPADVAVGAFGWDWARYLQYYAPDPKKLHPLLRKGYEDFDNQLYALAHAELTSASASLPPDPLTLTKRAWYLVSPPDAAATAIRDAGELLKKADELIDVAHPDKETLAKLNGAYLIYHQRLRSVEMAKIHAIKAVAYGPGLIGTRINYYKMLAQEGKHLEASMVAEALARDFPRSVQFQQAYLGTSLRANRTKGIIDSCEAILEMTPDDIATRLMLLPCYQQIRDSFRIERHCGVLLKQYAAQLAPTQKAQVFYHQAMNSFRVDSARKAESLAHQSLALSPRGETYYLLGDVLSARHKWSNAVLAYRDSMRNPWSTRLTFDKQREIGRKMDAAVDHLWSWQLKKMPLDVKARHRRVDARKVLQQSFVMRNRYSLRVLGIGAGLLIIGAAIFMRVRSNLSF